MTTDSQQLASQLNRLLATETHSLARHLDQAQPYLTAETYQAWSQIKHLATSSDDHARRLTALIDSLGSPPTAPVFDSEVANYHFMDVSSLLPLLIEQKQRQIEGYKIAIDLAQGIPSIETKLKKLHSENQAASELLENFAQTLSL